jgi:uncharacterized protein YndB with AHSA1/START domain
MIQVTSSVTIDAPPIAVWAVLSDLESIHHWVDEIEHAHCPGKARGVGAVRVCQMKGATTRETIVEWDEGSSFRYRIESAPLIKAATNRWAIEPRGAQTVVTSSVVITLKGGRLGQLLDPLVAVIFERMGLRSLARLKSLVEQRNVASTISDSTGPLEAP